MLGNIKPLDSMNLVKRSSQYAMQKENVRVRQFVKLIKQQSTGKRKLEFED